jgi:hypothetical protein
MSAGNVRVRASTLADVVGELGWGGAGRPAEIARRLGPVWTEDGVRAALGELFCDGVVGHSHGVGFWWLAR